MTMRREYSAGWVECLVFILIALAVRLDFLFASQFVIDSDEAIVGLMAKHISEGRSWPIFYYGQAYMGSLEALCAALFFLIGGSSSVALKLVPLLWSVLLVVSVYWGGRRFLNLTTARIATLMVAFASNGFLVWSTMARGGFIEIIVISFWVLLSLAWWNEDRRSVKRAALVGGLLGLGWWTNNQIVFLGLPAAILACVVLWSEHRRAIAPLLASAGMFLIGGLPFWYYNIVHDFPSSKVFGLANSTEWSVHFEGLLKHSVPMILGARRFWHDTDIFYGATVVVFAVILAPLCVGLLRLLSRQRTLSLLHAAYIVIPWAFLLFSLSKYGFLVKAPRYLLPLVPLIAVLVAYEISQWRSVMMQRCAVLGIVVLHAASLYWGGRAIPGQPFIYGAERAMVDHTEVIQFLESKSISKVRTNYWLGYRLAFETQERVTFGLIGEPRDLRIPSYQEGVDEQTPLLVTQTQVSRLAEALRAQGRSFTIENIKRYALIYNISASSCAHATNELSYAKAFSVTSSSRPDDIPYLFDKVLGTRWGSGAPQSPGMFIDLQLKKFHSKPLLLSWSLGDFQSDFPRGFQINVRTYNGAWQTVLSPPAYEGLKFLYEERPAAISVCIPPKVAEIRLLQTGRDSFFDWSLAEITLKGAP